MAAHRPGVAGLLILLAWPLAAGAQPEPVTPAVYADPNLPRDIPLPDPTAPPAVPPWRPPVDGPAAPPPTARPSPLVTALQLDQTYLPRAGHHKGFGVNDTEMALTVATPWEPLGKPVRLKGGWGIHLWDGPTRKRDRLTVSDTIRAEHTDPDGVVMSYEFRYPRSGGPRIVPAGPDPALPGAVYDLYLDVGWRPRLAEWLFADLGVTPGVYGDFRTTSADFFRLRGRGLAIVALSEKFQFVAGVLYVNRNQTKLIPAGGVLWRPNEWTDYQLVFPVPKAGKRLGVWGGNQAWAYLAGEFGGGTWAVERPGGRAGSVDYNDYRLVLGAEVRRSDGWNLKVEAGPVFGRELVFADGVEYRPSGTWMARAGLNF